MSAPLLFRYCLHNAAESRDAALGQHDAHIPKAEVDRVKAAHPAVQVFSYDAGHGFNNDAKGSYAPEAAKLACGRSLDFLKEHIGGI